MARYLQRNKPLMKQIIKTFIVISVLLTSFNAFAQNQGYDVFVPISKYIAQGNSDNLSAWFSSNLEISVLGKSSNASKSQAKQIVKSFFDDHNPRSFEITHTAGQDKMKYALGTLIAGGERFTVTLFVHYDGTSFMIQQLKIDKQN